MKGFQVAIILSAFVASCLSAVDETLVEKARGSTVVEAVLNKIESSCVFGNDNLFLRRIAYVESSDGTDQNTYRAGYYGGIWQVDQQMFEQTRTSPLVSAKRQAILNYYGFNWNSVQWSDLLKPFYSGLAARLFNQLKTNSNSKFSSVSEQANFWKTNYRLNGDESTFVSKTNALQNKCIRGAADVMFIVDESGSIGINNYNKVKDFLKDVVNSLNVGPDPVKDSRISLLTFSNFNNLVFNFKSYSTKASYISAISNMGYYGGGTNTYLALKYLRENAFDSNSGARTDGVPKIAIVLTDGQSNDFSATLVEARKLQQTDMTILSVGVGGGVNVQELDEIATDPDCQHRFLLDNFQAFDSFLNIIEKKTCDAPVVIKNETTTTLPTSGSQQCKVSLTSNGITIEIYGSGGNSTIYFSNITSPSASFYDYKFYFGSDVVTMYLPYSSSNDRSNSYVYCLIEGEPKTNVTVNPCSGNCDQCSKKPCPAGKICKNDVHFTYKCVNPELPVLSGYNCGTNNPCTIENALKNLFYFPSTVDGYFVQCSEWGQCFVMPCPRGLVWNVKAYTCTPANWNGTSDTGSTGNTDSTGNTGSTSNTGGTGSTGDPKDPTKYGYDCNTNNPCTPTNAALKRFYFPARLLGSFIQCSEWGQCYTMPCPPGQVWNVDKYTCTPPGTSSGNDGSCEGPKTPGGYPGDGYDCGKRNPCTADNRAKNLYYFSHSDPNKFVQCGQWGSCDIMPCPPGLVWNVKLYTCTPPNWTNNPNSTNPDPTSDYDCGVDNPCTPENRAKGLYYFPGKVQTNYVQCDGNGACYVLQCPSGLVWSTKDTACNFPESNPVSTLAPASCAYDCGSNNPCTQANRDKNLYYFPNANSSAFVQCDNFGGCFVMPCPPGQAWNVHEYTCTPTTSGSNSNGGSGGACPTSPSGTYDCAAKNPCTPENVALNIFYFPYKDSSKFVQCSAHGSCYIMPCPSGQTWNVRANTCTP